MSTNGERLRPTPGRLRLVALAATAAFVALGLQAWRLQVVQGRSYREQADYNRVRISAVPPMRGVIYDRNGVMLAANTPSFVVSVVPADLPKEREPGVARRLSAILDMDLGAVQDALDKARGAADTFAPVVVARGIDDDAVQRVEEQHTHLPGVVVQPEPERRYPEGPLLGHLLGYLGSIPAEQYDQQRILCASMDAEQRRKECYGPTDRIGIVGLEREYQRELRGTPGQRLSEVDVSGRTVRELREEPPDPGLNLVLNLDVNFQSEVDRLVREGLRTSPSGVAIVSRPTTGEILAMVALPSYDDNIFVEQGHDAEIEDLLADPNRPLFNRAISGQYPPGSTFKLVTSAGALHEKIADRNTVIESKGAILVPNEFDPKQMQRFPDWGVLGRLNFVRGLALSSDVYFYYLGGGFESFQGLGNERLATYARQFGFGARTGIDLPGEAEGIVPDERWKQEELGERWVKGDTYNMSIGQGYVAATPLQVATATNAFANGGTLYRPRLVHALVNQEGKTVREFAPEKIRTLPLAADQWALIREGMEAGYSDVLLRNERVPGLRIAGKTGTAEFYGPRNAKGELPTHAWYTGYAPADKPEIAVTVFVELGSGSNEAAPIASKIFRKYFNVPDVPPTPTPGPRPLVPAAPAAPGGRPAPAAPNAAPSVPNTAPAPEAPALGAPGGAAPAPAAPAAPPAAAPAAPPAAPAAPPAAPAAPALPVPAAPTLGPRVGAVAPPNAAAQVVTGTGVF
ncbi:MAG TPA: penicillin-binding protein 2 [Chloroflexota bacterium]|jgi:penicillin-binding protein 2